MEKQNSIPEKPNLFVIGFAKSGTTAIYQYLSAHPNIHACFPKEPHFFIEPEWHRHPAKTEKKYLGFFSGANKNTKVLMDSSALHVYSLEAQKKIHTFNPDAKIIVMLRNPVDMLISFHNYLYRTFLESEPDFKKAWELQSLREKGESIPKSCKYPIVLNYKNLGRLGFHVSNVLMVWPREQVRFVFIEDFVADPLKEYRSILEFLEVPYDGKTDFPRVNEGGGWRSPVIGKIMLGLWPLIIEIVSWLDVFNLLKKPEFWMHLWKMNSKEEEKIEIDKEFREKLIQEFREDIKLLSDITGKNLDSWMK